MRKVPIITLLLLISAVCSARRVDNKKKSDKKPGSKQGCNRRFLGVSTGLNNSVGLIGGTVDLGTGPNASIEVGAGISSWGFKITTGARYYFKPCFRGWALGGGLTRCGGTGEFATMLPRENGTQESATLVLHPVYSAYAAAYNYTSLGKKGSRFYVMLGLTARLTQNAYEQTGGTPMDNLGKAAMKVTIPGTIPIVCAIGFSFALGE